MIETQVKEQGTCAGGRGPVAQDLISKVPSPEVLERATRRTYPAEYKRAILREVDSIREPGELGALLRREGLYSSHIATWRWQRERGELDALRAKKRGPKSRKGDPVATRLHELERENRRLRKRLERAELIIDIQKKFPRLPLDVYVQPPEGPRERRGRLMKAVMELQESVGIFPACEALGVSRASYYRSLNPSPPPPPEEGPSRPFRALSQEEEQRVVDTLNSDRFLDHPPLQVYAALLDEGVYLCSISTMYRI